MKSAMKWAIASLVALNLPWMTAETARAGAIKSLASFQCQQVNGYYATVAVQRNGRTAPVIAWTSEEFSDAGYTPQRRCGEVTSRLNGVLRENGNRLSNIYLTVGRVNSHTVVCSVGNMRSGCNRNNVLFTLSQTNRRSNDPREVLERLFNTRVLSSGNPVQESGGQPYVNLESLVNQLF
ncbi:MAG: hypothetical protein BJG00_015640 [Limnothrix sp. CACIAM 69d]|nr:MAG: hypothetical protein BJG00_015640 [Limnothrix sp. CACIAM 69d]